MIRVTSFSSFSCSGPRSNQEDYVCPISNDINERIFILCDGMGGHGHGEVASRTVSEALYAYLTELKPIEYIASHFQDALDFALVRLKEADVFQDEKTMGTTVVVVAINKMSVLVGHIGDSRCYQFDVDGMKKFCTKDHSKVQEAVDAEILTEEEARNNPHKNILTRCVMSSSTEIKIDVDIIQIEDGDTLLMCSDGVTDAMNDNQIQSVIIGRNADKIASAIQADCELNSHDNFSAIILQFSQDENNVIPPPNQDPEPPKSRRSLVTINSYCPKCGNTINRDAQFCPHCGCNVNDASEAETKEQRENGNSRRDLSRFLNKKNLLLIVGSVVACSLAAWGIRSYIHGEVIDVHPTDSNSVSSETYYPLFDVNSSADTVISDGTTLPEIFFE